MRLFICLLLFMALQGCSASHEVKLNNSPLNLTVRVMADENLSQFNNIEILPGSMEYKAFNSWLSKNRDGWSKEDRKWLSPYLISGKGFSIRFSGDLAVLIETRGASQYILVKDIDGDLVEIFSQYASGR